MEIQKDKGLLSKRFNLDSDWESCVYELFNPGNHLTGEEFFESTILSLSKYLNADFVFIAQLNDDGDLLETVAQCNGGEILPVSLLNYKGSPCQKVLKGETVTCSRGVCEKFPEISKRFDKDIQGYFGVPLFDSSRKTVGVLSVLFRNIIKDEKKIEALMFMFASRVSSELEHLEKQRELKRRNLELLVFREELIRKNKELDEINREFKQATLKAKESDKLKTSFLANLSHEVRTPMNAIIGFTELLKSNNLSHEEKAEYLNIIHQNGNQLMRVMDALIDISKLQTKVYVESKEKVKLNALMDELCRSYSEEIMAMHKPVKVTVLHGADKGKDVLETHRGALRKIFDHLISNAIKFTYEGEIYLGYTFEEGCFEFFVKDTGVGIPEGHEKSIFDLFRQANLGNSREFGGNGIGLAIVKRYVEIMNGRVWAEPNQAKGALLKFRIPV